MRQDTGPERFDIALSFAGPDRDQAETLAERLRAVDLRVFYDRWFDHELLGRNAIDYLVNIYREEARFCVALISHDYDAGVWTTLEREAIQSRELRGQRDTLLPVMLTSYRPHWLPESRIYFDLSSRTLDDLVTTIARRAAASGDDIGLVRPEVEPPLKRPLDLRTDRPRIR